MTEEEILAMTTRIEKLEEIIKEMQVIIESLATEVADPAKNMTIDDLHDIYDGMQ